MALSRLRVRELLFLVVYAALIGQAFVLGTATSVRSGPPSEVRGYIWVSSVELLEQDLLRKVEQVRSIAIWRGGETLLEWSPQGPLPPDRELRHLDDPLSRENIYYLVPEELVK